MAASKRSRFLQPALCGGLLLLLLPSATWADSNRLKDLLSRAEQYERSFEWDKAFACYDEALKGNRNALGVKDRQVHVLRRFWQEQRHKDISYRKEVLSLDYGQSLRLYGLIFDTLIENSIQKDKLLPGEVLRKGIEELETACCDPGFIQAHLGRSQTTAVASFRAFLHRKKAEASHLTRGQCMKSLREMALAAQSTLELNPTVAVMELACGSCYAIDEYTAYLTPTQYRELAESLRPTMMGFTPSVQFAMKTVDVGYVQINLFQETTPQELDDAFHALNKAGMKGLVLDLRGNPGGLVESAVEVARRFLANGVITSTENFDPRLNAVYHSRNAGAWTVPLVVLVDSETASAAEVLAGALKDNGRARLVGQPTFGKGSSQGLIKLPDATGGIPTGGMRLTIARFLSPKGLPYTRQGVMPDLVLERFAPMGRDGTDLQVAEAYAELIRLGAIVR